MIGDQSRRSTAKRQIEIWDMRDCKGETFSIFTPDFVEGGRWGQRQIFSSSTLDQARLRERRERRDRQSYKVAALHLPLLWGTETASTSSNGKNTNTKASSQISS